MAPNVYSLTPLTRSVNLQRRVVIQGFDLPLRGLTIAGLALIPAIPLAAISWPFLGSYALLSVALTEGAAFWLVESRTRTGLQLRRYQRFVDMRRSVAGTFLVCGEPVDPLRHEFGYVVASSMPGRPAEKFDVMTSAPAKSTRKVRNAPHGSKRGNPRRVTK